MMAEQDQPPHRSGSIPAMLPRPPRRLSTWGALRAMATAPMSILDDELFGELVAPRRYVTQPVFFVSDPEGVRRVMLENFDNYPRLTPIRRLFEAELRTGSLASEGETWRRHRRISTPALDARAIAPDVPALIALAEHIASGLDDVCGGPPINLERWVCDMALQLWNQVVTGANDPGTLPMMGVLQKIPRKPRLYDLAPKPAWLEPLFPRRQAREQAGPMFDQLETMIDARLDPAYAGPRDLIWRVAHGVDKTTGLPLPRPEIRDEAANLLAGGSASARAMTWTWYLLSLYPEVEARMHAELDRVLDGRPATPEQLPTLTYTRQVLDESMRLYPPIPALLREAKDADVVCGHKVPRGSVMAVLPYVIHRHRKLWEDPDRFDPERFAPGAERGRPRLAYIPFAVGPRICVGASLSITQLLVVVSTLARRYRFRLDPDRPVLPFGGVTLQPRGGLWATVERR